MFSHPAHRAERTQTGADLPDAMAAGSRGSELRSVCRTDALFGNSETAFGFIVEGTEGCMTTNWKTHVERVAVNARMHSVEYRWSTDVIGS